RVLFRSDRPHRRGSAACPATTAHRGTAGPPGGGIPLRTDATARPGRIPRDTCGPEGPSHIPLRILRETPSAATSTVPAHAFPLGVVHGFSRRDKTAVTGPRSRRPGSPVFGRPKYGWARFLFCRS